MQHISNESGALTQAFLAAKKYNEQFGGSGAMLASIFDFAFQEKSNNEDQDSLAFKRGQRVSFDEFLEQHQPILERLGLGIIRITGEGVQVFGGLEGTLTDSKIHLFIEDPARFMNVLSQISDEEVDKNTDLRSALESLCSGSASLVMKEGKRRLSNAKEEIFAILSDEQISSLLPLMDEFSRLGLKDNCKFLHEMLLAHKDGFLPEQVLVESHGLLLDRNSAKFGPGEWVIDMRPELYRERWKAASESIPNYLSENPAAHLLLNRVVSNLLDCIEASRERIAKATTDYIKQNAVSYIATLDDAETILRLYSLL